jgi:hypothetical protein
VHNQAADLHEAAAVLQENHAAEMSDRGLLERAACAEALAIRERGLVEAERLNAEIEWTRAAQVGSSS